MRRRSVSVSRLADYASDPQGFIARRGDVRNRAAARAGVRHHNDLGREPLPWAVPVIVTLLLALLVILGRMALS